MKKFRRTTHSIKNRIFLLVMSVVLIQAAIFLFLLLRLDIRSKLKDNDISFFKEGLNNKVELALNNFNDKWSNSKYMNDLLTLTEKTYRKNKIYSAPLEINESIASALVNMLNNMNASGACIVFDKDPKVLNPKETFSIWDYNTKLNSITNSNILVGGGSAKLARNLNLGLNSYWSSKYEFDTEEKVKIYSQMLDAYKAHPNIDSRELGIWSNVHKLSDSAPNIISYHMPLIDTENGEYYGFLGVDIDLDYINELLFENSKMNNFSYAIVKLNSANSDSAVFDVIVFNGVHFADVTKNNQITIGNSINSAKGKGKHILNKTDDTSRNDLFRVMSDKGFNIVAAAKELKLYNNNSPYDNQKWYILKISEELNIYSNAQKLTQATWLPALLATVFGIIAALAVSFMFSSQLKTLLNSIQNLKDNPNKEIPRVNIYEIDELSQSVEKLNRDVEDSASRMQQIIKIIDMPIGAIEIDSYSDQVFLTGRAAQLLQFSDDLLDKTVINEDVYYNEYNRFLSISSIYENEHFTLGSYKKDVDTKVYELKKDNAITYLNITTKTLNNRLLKVVIDVTENISKIAQIQHEKDHDTLTGIFNRQAFKQRVSRIIEKRDLKCAAMIMWDLDNLKYVNDSYGHDFGDKYIIETARIISEINIKNAIVARISGDEFFAFVHDFDSRSDLMKALYDTQQNLISTSFKLPGNNEIKIRATAGVSWYPEDSLTLDELMKYADFAMLSGKNTQKGSINEFSIRRYNEDYILLSGKEDLNDFIEKEQVSFAFQPIVDAKTAEVFAYEGLMRPTSENIKSVYDVMRLAKAQSKLYLIEKLTWFGVLKAYQANSSKMWDKKLFINSIPNTFISIDDQIEIMNKYSDVLSRIVIEIIESEKVDTDIMIEKQHIIDSWNCSIALDDFGAGYSTESALLTINPEYIKIDMSIIRDIHIDKNRQKLVSNILGYAKSRGVKVIAEGVETMQELEVLVDMDVDYLQGYLLGKPDFDIKQIDMDAKMRIIELNRDRRIKEINKKIEIL